MPDSAAATDAPAPFADVRVLELSASIAGQTAGMLLGALGADVIAASPAEPPPVGSRELAGWLYRNRGKRLARVSTSDEIVRAAPMLIQHADVILTDLTPTELERAGLGHAEIAAVAPGCVHTWLPPTASCGPFRDLPHDQLLLDGLSGFASYFPAHEDRPVAAVGSLRPVLHGAMGATHAAIELVGRERDGQVGRVVVGGLRAAAMANFLLMIGGPDGPMVYGGNKHIAGNAHYRFYEAADGEWLFLGGLGDALFIEALTVLGRLDILARPDVGGDFRTMLVPEVSRVVGRELEATFRTRTAADWEARFVAADVPVARARTRAEWLTSDIVAHACAPIHSTHEQVGELLLPGVPLELSSTRLAPGVAPRSDGVVDLAELADAWSDTKAPTAMRPRVDPPLAGTCVVEMALFVAAPVIGSLLGACGADVVKIEPPRGDPYRSYGAAFAVLNHGKRFVRLDVAEPDGRERLLALASTSDVLIDNLRPASLDRLGLTDEVIAAAAPDLVRASVTAFGQTGPWVGVPGFDPVLQALSGLAVAQGGDDRPVSTSSPPHDVATGILGALGVAASLYARERGGGGRRVLLSLAASSTMLQAEELAVCPSCAPAPLGGRDHPGPSPWHRYYRAADGWIAVGAFSVEKEQAMALLVGVDRGASPELVADRCSRAFADAPVDHWVGRLRSAGVPAGPVLERGDFEAPFLAGTGFVREIDVDGIGRLHVLSPFEHTE